MRRWHAAFAAIALAGACLVIPQPARAGTLSLEPLRSEVTIQPGEATSGQLTVRNGSQLPATVTFSAEAFSVVDEAYNYDFDPDAAITRWVQFSQPKFDLKPGETRKVDYAIGAPTDAEPGGKYFALIAALETQDSNADGINPVQRAASLVYMTVPGAITKQGQLKRLDVPHWTRQSPVSWSLSLSNTGSVHYRSRLTLTTRDIFGRVMAQAEYEHLILPNTVRFVSGTADLGSWPGIYQLQYMVGLGDVPATRASRWVVYTPLGPTALLIGLFAAMAIVGLRWRRKRTTESGGPRYK